ncbi:hypothetical protein C7M84_001715 [Penaeus vannamei]|uniref:Uncharacterized protein n=1 Tax=Penaeus vannamei TaxID=6689 RepID=A0A3R7QVB5_PENVA|nr:hypothetical protein C7M84_001715 [Penaeus vannamei]
MQIREKRHFMRAEWRMNNLDKHREGLATAEQMSDAEAGQSTVSTCTLPGSKQQQPVCREPFSVRFAHASETRIRTYSRHNTHRSDFFWFLSVHRQLPPSLSLSHSLILILFLSLSLSLLSSLFPSLSPPLTSSLSLSLSPYLPFSSSLSLSLSPSLLLTSSLSPSLSLSLSLSPSLLLPLPLSSPHLLPPPLFPSPPPPSLHPLLSFSLLLLPSLPPLSSSPPPSPLSLTLSLPPLSSPSPPPSLSSLTSSLSPPLFPSPPPFPLLSSLHPIPPRSITPSSPSLPKAIPPFNAHAKGEQDTRGIAEHAGGTHTRRNQYALCNIINSGALPLALSFPTEATETQVPYTMFTQVSGSPTLVLPPPPPPLGSPMLGK